MLLFAGTSFRNPRRPNLYLFQGHQFPQFATEFLHRHGGLRLLQFVCGPGFPEAGLCAEGGASTGRKSLGRTYHLGPTAQEQWQMDSGGSAVQAQFPRHPQSLKFPSRCARAMELLLQEACPGGLQSQLQLSAGLASYKLGQIWRGESGRIQDLGLHDRKRQNGRDEFTDVDYRCVSRAVDDCVFGFRALYWVDRDWVEASLPHLVGLHHGLVVYRCMHGCGHAGIGINITQKQGHGQVNQDHEGMAIEPHFAHFKQANQLEAAQRVIHPKDSESEDIEPKRRHQSFVHHARHRQQHQPGVKAQAGQFFQRFDATAHLAFAAAGIGVRRTAGGATRGTAGGFPAGAFTGLTAGIFIGPTANVGIAGEIRILRACNCIACNVVIFRI